MEIRQEGIVASPVNPFDESYNDLQLAFDSAVIKLLCSILKLNLTLSKSTTMTNLNRYRKNGDDWIVDQIVAGSAEISSTSLILTGETNDSCHYSFGIGTYRPQLYYKARSLRDDNDLYYTAYSPKVLIYYFIVFVLLVTTLTFAMRMEEKLPHEISYDVFARVMNIQKNRISRRFANV